MSNANISDKFKCETCSCVLTSKKYLINHIKKRHNSNLKKYICDYDGKEFSLKQYLRMHIVRHQSAILTCNVCMKSYASKYSFRKHLLSHLNKFVCKECGTTFNHKILLTNHMDSKHNTTACYSCNFCTRTFTSKSARNNHHQIVHRNKDPSFHCKLCKINFETKEELRIHSFIHFSGDIHHCLDCDQIFKSNRMLQIHQQKHSIEKKFKCENCYQTFTFQSGLRKHERLFRCKGFREEDADKSMNEVEIARSQLKEISSQDPRIVNRKARKRKQSEQEEEILLPDIHDDVSEEDEISTTRIASLGRRNCIYTCDKCGEKVKNRKNFEHHMKSHQAQKYLCKECGASFKSRQKYLNHSINEHNVKLRVAKEIYSCDYCGLKFDVKSIFETHKLSHKNTREQICHTCGAGFKSVSNLHRHQKSVHATERSETCEICKKSFKTKMALKIHSENHVDVKVYVKCMYCNVIVQERSLNSHIRNSHTTEGLEKRFECENCQKAFKTESLLRRHMESVHQAVDRGVTYQCADCNFTTTRQRDLKEHELVSHFEGTVHVCECGSKFKTRRLLQIHMTTHNQNVTFSCLFCEHSCKTRSGMRKHLMKYHKSDENVEND